MRRGPRGRFRSEDCTGGESMAALRMNCSLRPPISAEHEARQAASTVIQILGMTRPGSETSLPT